MLLKIKSIIKKKFYLIIGPLSILATISLNSCAAIFGSNRIDKVKYLAIGDSIAAGYNADLGGVETSGDFDIKNKKVRGWSYPAFLANYINKSSSLILEDFTNLAVSGSQISDWLHFLGKTPEKYPLAKRVLLFQQIQKVNLEYNSPFKNRLPNYFSDFRLNHFPKIIKKIKEANLITISLAANDLTNAYHFVDLLVSDINIQTNKLSKTIKNINQNYSELITQIKSLNPNAKIVLTDYPLPLLRLSDGFDQLAKNEINDSTIKNFLSNQPLARLILEILNKSIIKSVAIKNNVNWIHVEDQINWNANARKYANNLFDIHPTIYGQKKIAQDIFLKLSLNLKRSTKTTLYHWLKLNPFWNESYLNHDLDYFEPFFKNNQSEKALVQNVAGDLKNATTFQNQDLENDYDLNQIWKNANHFSSLSLLVEQNIGYLFYQKALSQWIGLENEDQFNNYLANKLKKLFNWLNHNLEFFNDLYFNLNDNLTSFGDGIIKANQLNGSFNFLNAKNLNQKSLTNFLFAIQDLIKNRYLEIQKNSNQNSELDRFASFFEKNQALNNYLLKNIKKNFNQYVIKFVQSLIDLDSDNEKKTDFDLINQKIKIKNLNLIFKSNNIDVKIKEWIANIASDLFKNNKDQYQMLYQSNNNQLIKKWITNNISFLKTLLDIK
ncbi:SGNH/GDSL hydrolase family protein [[Mycoplasma] cavipharyngis]|uniref:SGNH/GDSL hydrolase family protein n=1 Tax=[Mycoplasma] cavipharyngis TaxID=92757 RepID=UPI00370461DC